MINMPITAPQNKPNGIDTDKYIPSSSDKKRAIMMYLILGIMVGVSKKNMNNFEYYHLKQAVGWWIVFVFILVLAVILLFIPIIKYIAILPLLVLVVVRIVSVKQARDGIYFISKKDSPLALFSGVGSWFVDLFEINLRPNNTSDVDTSILDNSSDTVNTGSQSNSNNITPDIEKDIINQRVDGLK